jgi:hypothetical protein
MAELIKVHLIYNIIKRTGEILLLSGFLHLHFTYRDFKIDVEHDLKLAKQELVDNLKIFTEEEFLPYIESSRENAKKEFLKVLFETYKINKTLNYFFSTKY